MTTEKTDMRIRKTKRALYQALEDLLQKKSLSQITVTELAARAEINKGTFYLHYKDIFELYQDALERHLKEIVAQMDYLPLLFSDANEFSRRLVTFLLQNAIFCDDVFLKEANLPFNRVAFIHFYDALAEKTLECGKIPDTLENRQKLNFLFSGVGFLLRYYDGTDSDSIVHILSASIEALFPQMT